jgi:hypothetical protein
MEKWNTILELKEDHKTLGFKGWVFFIVDFPMNIESGELLYMIAQPTFTGLGVTGGISSYVLNEAQINELFSVTDKTFKQYAKELEKNYFQNT